MNKKIIKSIFLLAVFAMILPSCNNSNSNNGNKPADDSGNKDEDAYKERIKSKDFKVINISYERQNANDPRFYEDEKPLSTYLKADTYKLYYLDEVNDIYYLPLSTYVDLFKGDFKDGVTNIVSENNGVATWTSKLENSTYTLSLDKNNQTITVKGTVEEFFKPVPNGRNGVFDRASIKTDYVEGHEEKAKTFSFKEYNLDVFEADGKICFPFALIAAETSKYIERKFLNASYQGYLVEYVSADQYADFMVLDDKNASVKITDMILSSYMELYGVADEHGVKKVVAPKALVEFNKKIIYYLFDNYYGLASVKGIKKMSTYFENLEESDKYFTSTNGILRGSGYYHVLQGLNDLHTSYGYSPFMSEGANEDASNDQSFYKDRMNLNITLGAQRERAIEKYNKDKNIEDEDFQEVNSRQVRYSQDGKYAYFSFDEFNTFNYYESGEIPESELFADAYYQFVKNLNEIKAKNTVKKVFIDDSLNGGGYVAIMGKLLALLSKDNKSVMYLRDQSDDSIQAITTSVDSNKDGKYDANDCYGNYFERFYIVTSSYSFSCGNAFPFYASLNNHIKVVGTQSGGGECCVFNFTFPTGQSITYSSPYHIGQYDQSNNTFVGDENGAFPWIQTNKSFDLYDVDSLGAFVTIKEEHS